jgi:hypothetical protein
MYIQPVGPMFGIEFTLARVGRGTNASESLGLSAVARRWRTGAVLVGLVFAVAFAIAAPVSDREIVPRDFVDRIQSAFDSGMPNHDDYAPAATAGEPVMSIAPACEPMSNC